MDTCITYGEKFRQSGLCDFITPKYINSKISGRITKIIFLVGFFTSFQFNISYAQILNWLNCYGGSDREFAFSLIKTLDDELVFAGFSESSDGNVSNNFGLGDCWIVKLDDQGQILWEKNYGGSGNESAYTIKQTEDLGYIFAGATTSNSGDVTGNHGGYDIWVVKIDAAGNIMWQKCLGGSDDENAYSVAECLDGGYILAGYTFSDDGDISEYHGGEDAWVVKLDHNGNLEWEHTYGGFQREHAEAILQTTDEGYLIGATKRQVNDSTWCDDAWIVKIDGSGNIMWEKTYGGLEGERISSIIETDNNEYVFVASASSDGGDVTGNHGSSDFWVVKINCTGHPLWLKCFGGSSVDHPRSIAHYKNGGFVVTGESMSDDGDVGSNKGVTDAWTIIIDDEANLETKFIYGGIHIEESCSSALMNNDLYILGYSYSQEGHFIGNHGDSDCWLAKLTSLSTGVKNASAQHSFSLYPNPSSQNITLEFQDFNKNMSLIFFNSLGCEVQHQWIHSLKTNIDVSTWTSGIYQVIVYEDGKLLGSRKFIVQNIHN
jgi:hypothetical protein